MAFEKLYQKSNSSISQLNGQVLQSTIEYVHGNTVVIDTGMRPPFFCSQNHLGDTSKFFSNEKFQSQNFTRLWHCPQKQKNAWFLHMSSLTDVRKEKMEKISRNPEYGIMGQRPYIGVKEKYSHGSQDFPYLTPKSVEKISTRKFIWNELTKVFHTNLKNRVRGFIFNSVNGGYAVAIAGYIAFLPQSLCGDKKVFVGQWRQFSIVNMNPKIINIVVKEVKTNLKASGKNKLKYSRNSQKWRKKTSTY